MTPEGGAAVAAAGVCAFPVQRVGGGEGAPAAVPGLPEPLQLAPTVAAWQAQEHEEGRKRRPRARHPHHLPSSCDGWLPRERQPENKRQRAEGGASTHGEDCLETVVLLLYCQAI